MLDIETKGEHKILLRFVDETELNSFISFRYIKMSSPHLNNLIILGCMCTYLSVIFLGLDSGLSGIPAFPYGLLFNFNLKKMVKPGEKKNYLFSLHCKSLAFNGWI